MLFIANIVQIAQQDVPSSQKFLSSQMILAASGLLSLFLNLLLLCYKRISISIALYCFILIEGGSAGATFLYYFIYLAGGGESTELVTMITGGSCIQFIALVLFIGHRSYLYNDVETDKNKIEATPPLSSDVADSWLFEPRNRVQFIVFLISGLLLIVSGLIVIVQNGITSTPSESVNFFISASLLSFLIIPSFFIRWASFRIGGIAAGLVAVSLTGWIIVRQVSNAVSFQDELETEYSQAVALVVGVVFYGFAIFSLIPLSVVRSGRLTDVKSTRNPVIPVLLLIITGWMVFAIGAVISGVTLYFGLAIGFGIFPIIFISADLFNGSIPARLGGISGCMICILFTGIPVGSLLTSSEPWRGADTITVVGAILSMMACGSFVLLVGIHEMGKLIPRIPKPAVTLETVESKEEVFEGKEEEEVIIKEEKDEVATGKSGKQVPDAEQQQNEAVEAVIKLDRLSQDNLADSSLPLDTQVSPAEEPNLSLPIKPRSPILAVSQKWGSGLKKVFKSSGKSLASQIQGRVASVRIKREKSKSKTPVAETETAIPIDVESPEKAKPVLEARRNLADIVTSEQLQDSLTVPVILESDHSSFLPQVMEQSARSAVTFSSTPDPSTAGTKRIFRDLHSSQRPSVSFSRGAENSSPEFSGPSESLSTSHSKYGLLSRSQSGPSDGEELSISQEVMSGSQSKYGPLSRSQSGPSDGEVTSGSGVEGQSHDNESEFQGEILSKSQEYRVKASSYDTVASSNAPARGNKASFWMKKGEDVEAEVKIEDL
jgi:hypothetical protein